MAFLKIFHIDVFYKDKHHTVYKRYTEFDRLNTALVCTKVMPFFNVFHFVIIPGDISNFFLLKLVLNFLTICYLLIIID